MPVAMLFLTIVLDAEEPNLRACKHHKEQQGPRHEIIERIYQQFDRYELVDKQMGRTTF